MSDTVPDVNVNTSSFTDLNTESGFPVGTALIISNKSNSVVLIQTSVAQPDDDSTEGEFVFTPPHSLSTRLVTAGENTVWAKSLTYGGPLSVQENG